MSKKRINIKIVSPYKKSMFIKGPIQIHISDKQETNKN